VGRLRARPDARPAACGTWHRRALAALDPVVARTDPVGDAPAFRVGEAVRLVAETLDKVTALLPAVDAGRYRAWLAALHAAGTSWVDPTAAHPGCRTPFGVTILPRGPGRWPDRATEPPGPPPPAPPAVTLTLGFRDGGWGAVLRAGAHTRPLQGRLPPDARPVEAVAAALSAGLAALHRPCRLTVAAPPPWQPALARLTAALTLHTWSVAPTLGPDGPAADRLAAAALRARAPIPG